MEAPFFGAPNGASISLCENYRYTLWRTVGDDSRAVAFVGLNPSTADATEDDPTIRRCMRFARDWGYGLMYMVNLYAYRSTDPKRLAQAADPVGPNNDWVLRNLPTFVDLIVPAWGAHSMARSRGSRFLDGDFDYAVLGLTKDKQPRHPLRIRADTVPVNGRTLEPLW